jgi:hypothetical protein
MEGVGDEEESEGTMGMKQAIMIWSGENSATAR